MISVLSVLAVLSVHSVLGAPWLGGSLRGVFDVQVRFLVPWFVNS